MQQEMSYEDKERLYKLARDMDEDAKVYANSTTNDMSSPLGDLGKLIYEWGYGCFLESAKGTSAWNKISHLQKALVRIQDETEVNMIYAALAILSEEETAEWKNRLDNM
jgi:hypothetical protein